MQAVLFSSWRVTLLTLLVFTAQKGLAQVAWTTIECNGNTVAGESVANIWQNAIDMTTNAQNAITTLTSNNVITALKNPSTLANNAKWMFDISVTWYKILPSSSRTTLTSTVAPVFTNVLSYLNSNEGYLICGGTTAQQGTVGSAANAWYYTLPGTGDLLVLSGQAPNMAPCSAPPAGTPPTLAQTFNGMVYPAGSGLGATPTGTAKGILLCTTLMDSNGYRGTLPAGFSATLPSPDFPVPDQYRSAAGTLIHEMIHATDPGKYQDQKDSSLFGDNNAAYGFNRCALLATKAQSQAFVNPDGYRIFAEMCMSPNTRWGAPKPPNTAAPPGKKRSIDRDGPRLNVAQRRTRDT
ncbi:hypothetical protein F5Y16DRAFT_82452 [Xylariaceae sp. FL0255]|nr:hypothetical protein F5Y16DRAFT_82452 [Xylariaceae sp. FL0255]